MERSDVQVLGAGVVGRCLALALARAGLRVALVGPGARPASPPVDDVRAYALNAASVDLLRSLRVWDALPSGAATAVHDMHVEGDRAGASIDFSAWRAEVAALAWIVDAAALDRELAAAVRFSPHVTAVPEDVDAPLTAYCDGRHSAGRERLGIEVERIDYGHRAVAARLVAERPHRGIARQWFRSPDVLALLPLDTPEAARSYALVWSLPDVRAKALMAADAASFEAALAEATGVDAVGALRLGSARADWPLARMAAKAVSGSGWVLLGDAAHVVHPLAGQGLNLGLADVAALVEVLTTREPWRGLGDPRLLRRYARRRAGPTWAMLRTTDLLWRLFADSSPSLATLRNQGLGWVDRATPLKRWLAGQAFGR